MNAADRDFNASMWKVDVLWQIYIADCVYIQTSELLQLMFETGMGINKDGYLKGVAVNPEYFSCTG